MCWKCGARKLNVNRSIRLATLWTLSTGGSVVIVRHLICTGLDTPSAIEKYYNGNVDDVAGVGQGSASGAVESHSIEIENQIDRS